VTVSADIGPGGGALALEGAALVIPAGAVARPTRFSITVLPSPAPSTRAITRLFRFGPDDLDLAVPARVTLPVIGFATSPAARWSVRGSTTEFVDVAVIPGSSVAVTSERTFLGRVYAEARTPELVDAGMPDAPPFDAPPRDAPPPDVPRIDVGPMPIAPVVVGPDLRPADYSCRGSRTAPATGGSVLDAPIRVVEHLDGGGRATFFSSSDALGALGAASTDSTGLGTVPARPGAWTQLDFEFTSGASDALTISQQTHHFVVFDAAVETRVAVLSQRTSLAIASALSPFGDARGELVGRVLDCAGEPVQRATIRVFAPSGELVPEGGFFGLGYGSGATPTPSPGTEHTAIDGRFFAVGALDPASGGAVPIRVEAWGALTLGGSLERLACEELSSGDGRPVVFDLGPARADASPGCL
jgi:hypothetical protein